MDIIRDENLINKLSDKTILITGVSGGLGVETMRALHATGAHVYGTVRNLEKGQAVIDEILASNPNGGKINLIKMELNSLASVRAGAEDFLSKSGGKLNILIANAGIMAVPKGKTVDGFEEQFATNHLSHFLLFQLVKDTLLQSASPEFPSRVISVASIGHRYSTIRFHDYNFDKEEYDKWAAYGQSKTANIWFTNAINRKYKSQNLYALALQPGGIFTGLAWALSPEEVEMFKDPKVLRIFMNAEQGAATTVFTAVGKEWRTVGGVFAGECQVQGPHGEGVDFWANDGYAPHAFDEEGEERLWKESFGMVGLKGE
jgi:NAD(P)-dependent dehydrogenase (short-subunit alcohol dehydrogenase family)